MNPRLLKRSWLTEWVGYYKATETPLPFALWSGIWALGSALQDRVFIRSGNKRIYPNNYVFLVGIAAGGKSTSAREAYKLLKETTMIDTYDGEVTKSYLISFLQELSVRQSHVNPGYSGGVRLAFFSDELGITISSGPAGEDFLRAMTLLYDYSFKYATHAHGQQTVRDPIISWLALATLPWLKRSIPPDLIDSGFVARVIAIVEPLSSNIVPVLPQMDPMLRNGLLHDLAQICFLNGEYILSPEAQLVHDEWYVQARQARIDLSDPIIQGIYGREDEQIYTIAMILMASSGDSFIISKLAMENAIQLVTRARESNVQLFRALASMPKHKGR